MDAYYLDSEISKLYLKRRKDTIIIGSDVLTIGKRAFFGSMGTGTVKTGYDLFITDMGDHVAINIGSERGEKLLKKAARVRNASAVDTQKVHAIRHAACEQAKRGLKVAPSGWYDLLTKNYESSVWKLQSDKCLACGTCTMVCPTCFCYDVVDKVDLKHEGDRIRTWDGCLLRQFTEVASGEIFRESIVERYRHRYFRKGKYLPDRLGFVACVGCGRCCTQCIPDIADPLEVTNMVFDASEQSYEESEWSPTSVSLQLDEIEEDQARSLHTPMPATIQTIKKLTAHDTLFEISLDKNAKFDFTPGQFVELSIMGVGEAPFGISSAPGKKTFDLVVRRLGDVTSTLHRMKKGDKIGIRGPLGHGFDIEDLKGRDLLIIGGGTGIIPLRSLIHYVLDEKHRKDYGEITILYGCREPCEMLFRDEVKAWGKRDDMHHMLTVDSCPEGECWEGDIGLITKLIPKVPFDPKKTVAIIVGPPVMYRFCIQLLLDLGVAADNIVVSLERRMKCGVGKCGHCQINHLYVCKDGPVFRYKDIMNIPEAFS
jgi:sulfite reductase subunit B